MRKLMNRFGKKTVYASVIAFSVLVAGVTMYFASVQGSELALVKDTQVIELGTSPFDIELKDVFKDYDKLLKKNKVGKVVGTLEDKEGKKIASDEITKENVLAVGTYKMNYAVEVEKEVKKFLVTYKVEDTTKPTFIDFKDKIEIEANATADLTSMFKTKDLSEVSVTVEADGKDVKYDPNVVGEYKMEVVAIDKYENKTTKKFTLVVVEKKTEGTPDGSNDATGDDNWIVGGNTNNGGNSNAGGSTNGGGTIGGGTPPPSNVCVPDGQFGRVGNSGKVFYSADEMHSWAKNYIINQGNNWVYSGYTGWTVYDNCGERNDVYTVDFYE